MTGAGAILRTDHQRRVAVLVVGLIFIVGWQAGFAAAADDLDDSFRVYFLGLGDSELGHLFLYLPYEWVAGSDAPRSVIPTNRLFFIVALVSLYTGFWLVNYPGLGMVTVLLVGSNPFQLYEVNAVENIFNWPISVGMLIMGLHLPMIVKRRPPRRFWLLPACTGVVLGTANFVRPSAIGIGVSVVLLYVLGIAIQPLRRLLMIAVLGLAFLFVYFTPNYVSVIRTGSWEFHKNPHTLWNAVWGGLGDFDNKYGHLWDDLVIHAYGRKVFFEKTGNERGDEWTPAYNEVLRDDVVHKITNDPGWYASILARRLWRVVGENTPPRLAVGNLWVNLPVPSTAVGLLVPLIFAGLAIRRNWTMTKVLGFPFSTALLPLAVYSGHGAAYYSVIHLFAVALAASWLGGHLGRLALRYIRGEVVLRRKTGNRIDGRSSQSEKTKACYLVTPLSRRIQRRIICVLEYPSPTI